MVYGNDDDNNNDEGDVDEDAEGVQRWSSIFFIWGDGHLFPPSSSLALLPSARFLTSSHVTLDHYSNP